VSNLCTDAQKSGKAGSDTEFGPKLSVSIVDGYGTPIGGFQAIQHYMANMRLAYDTSIYYLHKVAWMLDEGIDADKEVSALKAQVNEQYKFITERAVQIHGGIGTTREFNIGLFYRRAKAFEYILGDTDFHQNKIADALGL
jgi:alkylation response protein AidB-like acyl-CoA dehydrogenase